MRNETVLIAAYGTLRSGERNERFCRNAVSRRNATISGTLYDTGWGFPAFVPEGKTKVAVELIEMDNGEQVKAWIYIMNTLPEQAKAIVSGDWKAR